MGIICKHCGVERVGMVRSRDKHYRCFCIVCDGELEYWGLVRRFDLRREHHG